MPGTYKVSLLVSDFLGAGTPVTVTLVASSVVSYAEAAVRDACAIVEGLSRNPVTEKGNQKEFCKLMRQTIRELQNGHYSTASRKLGRAIERTDGCALRNTPDTKGNGRDWITVCSAQLLVYNDLNSALNALSGLPDSGPRRHTDDEDKDDD